MFKKWAGWKKVAACLMGAALLMQGGALPWVRQKQLNILPQKQKRAV